MNISRRDVLSGGLAVAGGLGLTQLMGCAATSPSKASHAAAPPSREIGGRWSLRSVAAEHRLLTGFAVSPRLLSSDSRYAALVRQQASIMVAENAMKWALIRPSPDRYFFDEADALINFAEQNRIRLRGHNLVWHRQLPTWFETVARPENARRLLEDHIQTVVGRYAGRMHSWDVVNEAIEMRDGRTDGLRNSSWLRLLGSEYLEIAFRAARLADPTALLTYNEYGIEGENQDAEQKRNAVLLMLRRLKARSVPLDAVGIQAHISARSRYNYGPGLMRFMSELREMDLQIFITEMDVNDRELNQDEALRDESVAGVYERFLGDVLREPAVKAVLFWGVDDGHTWLNRENSRKDGVAERPLLFDRQYRPKEAFYAVRDTFEGRGAARNSGGFIAARGK